MITILTALGIGVATAAVMFTVVYISIWAMNHNDDRVAVGFLLATFTLIVSLCAYFILVNA